MIQELIVSTVISFVVLFIGDRIISSRIPAFKLLVTAVLGQLFVLYALPFVMSVAGMFPVPRLDLVLEALVWIGLVNFVVPKTKPKEYIVLGTFAFVANFIVAYLGFTSLLI